MKKIFSILILLVSIVSSNAQTTDLTYEYLTKKGGVIVRTIANVNDNSLDGVEIWGVRQVFAEVPNIEYIDGSFQPIVVNVPGKTAEQLYNDALIWVQKSYKNPDEVLKSNIENKSIRIGGYNSSIAMVRGIMLFYYAGTYSIELSFKDGRYRLEFIPDEIIAEDAARYQIRQLINSDGTSMPRCKLFAETYIFSVNKMSSEIYKYMIGIKQEQEDDW
jgi:hypothetical protein